MDNRIAETYLEWLWDIQLLMKNGWTFHDIDYGEAKFGLPPKIKMKKYGEPDRYCGMDDINDMVRDIRNSV